MIDHVIVYEPEHAQAAADRLIAVLRKPRLQAFAEAIAAAAQQLEDIAFGVITGGTELEAATQHALRKWGAVVGEAQGDLTKADFLRFVLLRIQCNAAGRADRTPLTLEGLTALVVAAFDPSPVSVTIQPNYIEVTVQSVTALSESVAEHAGQLVHDCRPMGAAVTVTEQVAGVTFAYDTPSVGYDLGGVWTNRTFNGRQRHAG